MNTLRAHLIIFGTIHETLGDTLIDDEDDFGGELSAEKDSILVADVLPFGEIISRFGDLDAGWSLTVGGMELVLSTVMVVLVRSDGLRDRGVAVEGWIGSRGGGEKKRINMRAAATGTGCLCLWLRCICAGRERGR